jgi:uncharacterized protein (DUF433 family)
MAHERIAIDPNVMFGKPVIRGTRIPVELILRKLGDGMTDEQILTHHPHLTVDDIRAAATFAADRMDLLPQIKAINPCIVADDKSPVG